VKNSLDRNVKIIKNMILFQSLVVFLEQAVDVMIYCNTVLIYTALNIEQVLALEVHSVIK
jgi:hypothetical protein